MESTSPYGRMIMMMTMTDRTSRWTWSPIHDEAWQSSLSEVREGKHPCKNLPWLWPVLNPRPLAQNSRIPLTT